MARGVPKKVGVKVTLGAAALSGEWEPTDAERAAPREVPVELITRISDAVQVARGLQTTDHLDSAAALR